MSGASTAVCSRSTPVSTRVLCVPGTRTARYAIARGEVRPALIGSGDSRKASGHIGRLGIDEINVPFEFRNAFEHPLPNGAGSRDPAPFNATVAFGKRLEPWLKAAAQNSN